MRRDLTIATALLLFVALPFGPASSQDTAANDQPSVAEPADDAELLTGAELQDLVAPVALFPDTLLIQILVGATQPFDVMKADRLLLENAGASQDELATLIDSEGYDPSVAVLAEGFPDVVHRMAENIDWTETVGAAMLVQSDDVLDAVQVMRAQAIDTGALATTEQQVVTQDPADKTVIIQPADPQVVYIPQYDSRAVYDPGFQVGDAVAAGLISWGTFTIIDEIFDDDDDWGDYWGCRNCASWGGGPIIRDPDIDIDIDGNVNIGNQIGIDRDTIRDRIETGDILIRNDDLRAQIEAGDIDRGELRERIRSGDIQIAEEGLRARLEGRHPDGWQPEPGRREEVLARLEARQGEGGGLTLPSERPQIGGTDALRARLSERGIAPDIVRPELRDALGVAAAGGAAVGVLAGRPATRDRPAGGGRDLARIREKTIAAKPLARPAAKAKPAARPGIDRSAVQQGNRADRTVNRAAARPAPKIAKRSGGGKARAASVRGRSGGKKFRR